MTHLPPPPCVRLTEQVRNSCVMRGAAVIVCVCMRVHRLGHAKTAQTGAANTHRHTQTHTHGTQPFRYPTFQHEAEPTPPFPHTLHLIFIKTPKHFDCRIRLHNQADSETLVSVRELWIVLYGGWGHRVKCIAALPHCHFPNWNDRLRHIAPEYRS